MALKKLREDLHGRMPYCFDLFCDIKTMQEVNDILAGKPHCSGLTAKELQKFITEMGYFIEDRAPLDDLSSP